MEAEAREQADPAPLVDSAVFSAKEKVLVAKERALEVRDWVVLGKVELDPPEKGALARAMVLFNHPS
jgi:hypothetical protein